MTHDKKKVTVVSRCYENGDTHPSKVFESFDVATTWITGRESELDKVEQNGESWLRSRNNRLFQWQLNEAVKA